MIRIKLKDIKFNSFSKSSALFSGENEQMSWRSGKKQKQGFGTISGQGNHAQDVINIVTNRHGQKFD